MAYSSIKPVYGQCLDCEPGMKQRLTAGRCDYHYKKHRHEICQKRKSERVDKNVAIEKTFAVSKPQSGLFLWYADKIKQRSGYCMECGAVIPFAFAHHSIAHIVPKSPKNGFASVAVHPNNWIELGAGCGCHGRYDSAWSNAAKMKVFAIAVSRFKTFEHLITEEEKRRIPDVFLNFK